MKKYLALLLLVACSSNMETVNLGSNSQAITTGTHPNIVVIMTDDLDYRTMDVMLAQGLAPNIKQYLVDEGTVFSNSYVSNSLCCPSRATLLTGQYSHNNGVLGNGIGEDGDPEITNLDDTSTLATWLQAAGYRTGHIGKYLNGYGTKKDTTTPQYQEGYVPPGWNHWQALIGSGAYRMFRYKINDTVDGVQQIVSYGYGQGVQTENYQTTVLAQRAVSFLNAAVDHGGPFYLELMPVAPHGESNPDPDGRWSWFIRHDPQDDIDKPAQLALIDSLPYHFMSDPSFDYVSAGSPAFLRDDLPLSTGDIDNLQTFYKDRYKAMLAIDDMVGDVVQTLTERGVLENTVIIFTSDNGHVFGQHRWAAKKVAYEESIKVPLYIRVPQREMTSTTKYVVNADLAPTIAELAGVSPSIFVDGRSLLQFLSLEVPASTWRKKVFLEHWGEDTGVPTFSGVRTNLWLYVSYYNSVPVEKELYDMQNDPYQTINLYGTPGNTAVSNNLQDIINRMMTCVGAECRSIEAE